VYKSYPAATDMTSSASSVSLLFDSRLTASAADNLRVSVDRDVSDIDVRTFGDARQMIHCLAEHVIHGHYCINQSINK